VVPFLLLLALIIGSGYPCRMAARPETSLQAVDPADLIACPTCDTLFRARAPGFGDRAVCANCHAVLIAPRVRAGMTIIMLAMTTLILVMGALLSPFLRIDAGGFHNDATLLDTAFSFAGGPLFIVSLAVTFLIVVVPVTRAGLLLFVLTPIVFDRPAPRGARPAFALAERLRPWSMAEIFALGCAVSLVKVADLAQISFGPAFWMFAGLVVVSVVQDNMMCRWSVWRAIEGGDTS
jgi:paraquat-inducible protein A